MTLIQADAFRLPYLDKLFHACVTSPPYWGLRKYAGDQGEEPLGLEATPERHIERMVEIFREVRRVLRDDGVVWLNYGDCFSAAGWESNRRNQVGQGSFDPTDRKSGKDPGTRAGNLMLMPHRLAIALQDDGWIVRNDLVWFKRNPMPESVAGWRWERPRKQSGERATNQFNQGAYDEQVQGAGVSSRKQREAYFETEWEYGDDYVLRKSSWRHTRAHEYVFMLCKSMKYFCNQEVVREAVEFKGSGGISADDYEERKWVERSDGLARPPMTMKHRNYSGRNPRSVLDVPTAPYKGAHYATFPPKLIAPLIRASVPRRCCPECGMAWAPVVEKEFVGDNIGKRDDQPRHGIRGSGLSRPPAGAQYNGNVTDYRPTCECGIEEHEPGIVLDIFGGSGTTGMVAKQLLRRWVVMDISRPYLDEQSKTRTSTGTPSKMLKGLPLFEDIE